MFAVGPSFTTIPIHVNLLVDSDAVFVCSANANPAARVTWFKDGARLRGNSRITISLDGTQLTVADVRPEDAGVYTCVAENYVNQVSTSGSLQVTGQFIC